jgi:hypothetical protein
MKALAADQDRWQRHIHQVRQKHKPVPSLEKALISLTVSGATPLTWHARGITPTREPATRRRQPLDAFAPA